MAMFAALLGFVPKERLFCLHVEHSVRPAEECRGDSGFVRDFCEKSGVSCRVAHIQPGRVAAFARQKGIGIEAAARFFRRRALVREARRLEESAGIPRKPFILTAHTKNDALELALMRILRGAGPAGLAAMPVKRGRFLRPLLSLSRADVISYLKEKNIPWREDSSNTDEKFLRNKVRLRLVTLLDGFFPSWEKGLCGMAQTQSLAAEFLAQEAQARVLWEQVSGCFVTDAGNFFSQTQIIREEALYQGILRALRALRVKNLESNIKRAVVRRFCAGSVNAADLKFVRIKHQNGKIVLSPKREEYFEKGVSQLIK